MVEKKRVLEAVGEGVSSFMNSDQGVEKPVAYWEGINEAQEQLNELPEETELQVVLRRLYDTRDARRILSRMGDLPGGIGRLENRYMADGIEHVIDIVEHEYQECFKGWLQTTV